MKGPRQIRIHVPHPVEAVEQTGRRQLDAQPGQLVLRDGCEHLAGRDVLALLCRLALEKKDVVPGLRQPDGRRASRWTGADDDDVRAVAVR